MEILDRREPAARHLEQIESGIAGQLLAPLGALYASAVALRHRLDPPHALPPHPPSLAIGNLRVGGTGKTPIVADLGRRAASMGLSVAVLTRGFRGDSGGDEPDWLRGQGLRVEVGADRQASFARASAAGAQWILLDDALQSRVRATANAAILLEQDLVRMPRPLPAGPLRESARALRRVDFVFVRCEKEQWPELRGHAFAAAEVYPFRLRARALRALQPGDAAPRNPQFLLSGLARPASFEADALRFGLRPCCSLRLSDHARLGAGERRLIEQFVRERGVQGVVLPEKNLARFGGFLRELGLSVHALCSEIEWQRDPLPEIGERQKLAWGKN